MVPIPILVALFAAAPTPSPPLAVAVAVDIEFDGDGARCASRSLIEARLAGELDAALLTQGAVRAVSLSLEGAPPELIARLALDDGGGQVRTRTVRASGCAELVDSVVLALALALEADGLTPAPFAVGPRERASGFRRVRASLEGPVAPAPAPAGVSIRFGAHVGLHAFDLPSVALGPGIAMDIGFGAFGLRVDGAVTFAAPARLRGDEIGASRLGAMIAGCWNSSFQICAGPSLSLESWDVAGPASQGRDDTRMRSSLEVWAGVRTSPRTRLELGLGIPVGARARVLRDGERLWEAGALSFRMRWIVDVESGDGFAR